MGQRHQYIVAFPETFYNEGNPNNFPAEARIIHHQWLYGAHAVLALHRVTRLIFNSLARGEDYIFGTTGKRLRGQAEKAIAAAISVDPESGYFHQVHCYEEPVTPPQALDPRMLDNNDGVTVLQLEAGATCPKVCFATPGHLEGSHWTEADGCGPWSPAEYLSFYYSPAELQGFKAEDKARLRGALEDIKRMTVPMTERDLEALLPNLRQG